MALSIWVTCVAQLKHLPMKTKYFLASHSAAQINHYMSSLRWKFVVSMQRSRKSRNENKRKQPWLLAVFNPFLVWMEKTEKESRQSYIMYRIPSTLNGHGLKFHLHFWHSENWNSFARQPKQPFINCHQFLSPQTMQRNEWQMKANTIKTTAFLMNITERVLHSMSKWNIEKFEWKCSKTTQKTRNTIWIEWKWNIHLIRHSEKVTQCFRPSSIVLASVLLRLLLLNIYHCDSQAIT